MAARTSRCHGAPHPRRCDAAAASSAHSRRNRNRHAARNNRPDARRPQPASAHRTHSAWASPAEDLTTAKPGGIRCSPIPSRCSDRSGRSPHPPFSVAPPRPPGKLVQHGPNRAKAERHPWPVETRHPGSPFGNGAVPSMGSITHVRQLSPPVMPCSSPRSVIAVDKSSLRIVSRPRGPQANHVQRAFVSISRRSRLRK